VLRCLAVALLATCALPGCTGRALPVASVEDDPQPADIRNATVTGLFDEPVTLRDGRWEGELYVPGGASRPSAGLIDRFKLTADFDGDGRQEMVALLWSSGGGSGTLIYIAAFADTPAGIRNLDTLLIGDRVQVRSARVDAGEVVLEVVQQGPGDAACCPGEKATRRWRLVDGDLVEQETIVTGRLSVADLAGVEWRLRRLGTNKEFPAAPGATLSFDGGRLAGDAGCNRYFGMVSDGASPGAIMISGVGNTGRLCEADVMTIEDAYLSRLSSVTKFGFLNGDLALTWQQADAVGTMTLTPGPE